MGSAQTKAELELSNELLQQDISNILQTNSTNVSNIVSNINSFTVKVTGNCSKINMADVRAVQNIRTDLVYVAQVTSQMTSDIKKKIDSTLANKVDQSAALSQGLLAGLGQLTNTQAKLRLKNKVSQIISTYVNEQNLNSIINNTLNQNEQKIELNCGEGGEIDLSKYELDQNILVNITAAAIVNNAIGAVMDDQTVSSIINDIAQSASTTQSGLEAMILVWIVAIIAGAAVFIFTGKSLTSPTFLISIGAVIIVLGGIYLTLAGIYVWWPFTAKWKCTRDEDGLVTGTCESTSSGQFISEDECKEAIKNGTAPCGKYWGYAKNEDETYVTPMTCIEYGEPFSGSYSTKEKCESDDPAIWGCLRDTEGECISPKRCEAYSTPFAGSFPSYATCMK